MTARQHGQSARRSSRLQDFRYNALPRLVGSVRPARFAPGTRSEVGDRSPQRSGMIAEQPPPAHRAGLECALSSIRSDHGDGGAQDLPQGNGFMPVLGHVPAEHGNAGWLVDANQPMQDQTPAMGKEQDCARPGVLREEWSHDKGRTGGDQRVHAVAGGGEADRLSLPEQRGDNFGGGGDVWRVSAHTASNMHKEQ